MMYSPRSVSTRLQPVVLQALVEVDLLGGHRLRLHDQPRAALLREMPSTKSAASSAVAYTMRLCRRGPARCAFELLQIPVEIVDGVPLERVRLRAQFLVVRQRSRARLPAMRFPLNLRRWRVDSRCRACVRQRRSRISRSKTIGHRSAARQHFRQMQGADRQPRAGNRALHCIRQLESIADHRRRRRCATMDSILVRAIAARDLREFH